MWMNGRLQVKVTYGVGRAVLGSLAVLNVDVAVIRVEPVGADTNNNKMKSVG